jgi:hypothetical protein
MRQFRIADLRALAERRQWPCVSLYLPTHRAGRDTREDPIRLRNAVGGAKERLAEAGYPKDRAAEMLDPAYDLIASRDFWLHQSDGLAVFATPDLFQYYRVPLTFRDEVVVTDHFAIRQLIPLFTEDGRFHILALSQNRVRFFEATRTGIREQAVPDMLKSIDDLKQFEDAEESLQGHTMNMTQTRGNTDIVFHGQGNIADKARYKADVLQYIRMVARKLEKYLNADTAPLVLAAVEYEQAFYRQVNTYQSLVEEGIHGNPDDRNEDEIHRAAWEIVEPHFAQARQTSLGHFADLAGTGKTSDQIDQILPAALHGRVRTLYLRTDIPVWGRFDPDALSVETRAQPRDGDMDLLCTATLYVLGHKGTVYALRKEEMPTQQPQAAMFRY